MTVQLSNEEVYREWAAEKRKDRTGLVVALVITVLLFVFCLCWRYNAGYFTDKFVPAEYMKSYWLALKHVVLKIFRSDALAVCEQEIAAMDSIIYLGAIARFKITVMTFAAGGAIAVAGAIFQTAYRNPMASPNILGAGIGVRLGNVIVVSLYSTSAVASLLTRYKFCYGLTIICVGLILLIGRLLGGKKRTYSVMEMVMMGSIVTQGLNVLNMYLMYEMTEDDMLVLQQLQMGVTMNLDWVSVGIFFGVMAVSLIPVLILRYRINIISLDKQETTSIGVSNTALSAVCQVCGVLMVTCAAIHCGDAGMISMVIPYVVRKAVGSDFRKVCVYSLLSGGALMMVAKLVTSFVVIMGEMIPISFVLNIVLTPVFMVITAKRRKEQAIM